MILYPTVEGSWGKTDAAAAAAAFDSSLLCASLQRYSSLWSSAWLETLLKFYLV